MFGILDSEKIEDLLHKQLVGRLACHADDSIYIVPISYAYDGHYIYCHTYEGKKINMLRKSPKLCFQVDEMDNMADWKSVIVWGEYEELDDLDERKIALKALLERPLPPSSSLTTHIGSNWPFSSEDIMEIPGIFFRIKLHEKTGRFEKTGASPILPG